MASITYGTRTVLPNITRLHSLATANAKAFGEIDNSSVGALDYGIFLQVPVSASATAGLYKIYLLESQDGVEWTDDIDPTADSGDVAAKINDAKLLWSSPTVYNATTRTDANIHFNLSDAVGGFAKLQKYNGLVLLNSSGQTTPSSGADGDSQSIIVE